MKKYSIVFLMIVTVNLFSQTNPEWIVIDTSNSLIPSNHVEEIFIDNLNRKWISLYENGILKIEGDSWSIFNASNSPIPNNIVTTMNVDNNLNFWAGGYGFITKFDSNTWTVWINPTPGVLKTSINFDEQNDVWFLSRNDNTISSTHYLAEFSDDSLWTTHSSFNTENGTRQMLIDSDTIWIGDSEGLFLFSGDSLQFIQSQIGPYGLYITDIKKDSSGNIWLAVGLGGWGTLVKYGGNSFSGFSPVATAIEFDSEGNLWIGTESFTFEAEIIKYDGANWTTYNTSNSQMPATNMITDLAFDSFGNLWIGTIDAGLLIFNENGIVPVELISFSANVEMNNVSLNWVTSTETNNRGFEIQKRAPSLSPPKGETLGNWEKIGFVEGKGTTTERQTYSFTDENLSAGKYQYRLKQIDFDGTFEYSSIVEVEINQPLEFSLEQNYPNPFNPTTKIKYTIPQDERRETKNVRLIVYDVLGNEVAILVNEEQQPGIYEVEFNGSNLSSGVYFYSLTAGSFKAAKKLILTK
jgi:hypothetical protein